MSKVETSAAKARATTRVADFVAFVKDRDTEQVLKDYVLEQVMPHAYIAVGGVDEAIAYLAKVERSPLFLIIDLAGSAMPLSDLGQLSQVCEPSVQVVALGERNDVGLFRSLLKLGVRDYLVKPVTVELLMRTVNFAEGKVSEVSSSRVGKMIAFAGVRGGVGTTTLALNVARHLSEEAHRRVAFVDLDIYSGAAAGMLGLKSNNGLTDVLLNMSRLDPQYVERTLVEHANRFYLLCSEIDFMERKPFAAGALTRVLQILCDSFHYVVVDIGRLKDALADEAFDHASRVYLVSDRTVHAARQTIRVLRHIESRGNNPQTSILLNNPNSVTSGKVDVTDFNAAVERSILHEVQFEPKSLAIAENLGESPKEKSANGFNQSIKKVANDLVGKRDTDQKSVLRKFTFRRA